MPSLTSAAAWPVGPPLYLAVATGVLYWHGLKRARQRRVVERRARAAAFYLGLLTIVVALDSPLDVLSDKLFAAHMTQHVLLLTVVPPLLLLGEPSLPAVAAASSRFPAERREVRRARGVGIAPSRCGPTAGAPGAGVRSLHRGAARVARAGALRRNAAQPGGARPRALPLPRDRVAVLGAGDHVEAAARAARRLGRAVYATGALLVSWVLAIVLAFAPSPLYSAYASLPSRPGGLSALADQQLAAGIMWVPGSIAFTIAIFMSLYRWLEPTPSPRRNGHLRTVGN